MSRIKYKNNITMYDVVGTDLYKGYKEDTKIKHFGLIRPEAKIIWCRIKLEGKDE